MKKKILSFLTAFAMVLVLLVLLDVPLDISAAALEPYNSNSRNITFVLTDEDSDENYDKIVISDYSNTSMALERIAEDDSTLQAALDHITTVEVTDGVTRTGSFSGCVALKTVKLPDSLTALANSAFWNCTSLESVNIPNGVTSIPYQAFKGCSSLKSILIPDSVTEIGEAGFIGCSSLERVEVPSNVTKIGSSAFSNCTNLKSASILGNVTINGSYTFLNCTSLKTVTINGINKIPYGAFYQCSSLESIKIPDNATSIGDLAFADCLNLKSVDISNNSQLQSIGVRAFSTNSYTTTIANAIESLYIPPTVTSVARNVFDKCADLKSISYPSGLDVSNANIPNTATKAEYTKGADGTVTITKIIPSSDGSIILPEDIGGAVPTISQAAQDDLKTVKHTHSGGEASCFKKAVCEFCGTEYGELAEHNFGEWTETTAPTCTSKGEETRTCQTPGCTETQKQEIAALEHSFPTEWTITKAATCTEKGIKERICTRTGCNEKETADIDMLGHDFPTEWTVQTAPTCTGKGKETRTCKRQGCTETQEREIAVLGHNFGEWKITKAPTCTATGIKERICTRTGCNEKETETVQNLGHMIPTDWEITVQPTCTTYGEKVKKCQRAGCGQILDTERIEKLEHNYLLKYDESGHWTECSSCGDKKDSAPHSLVETVITPATETEKGLKRISCSCGYSATKEIPVLTHTHSFGTEWHYGTAGHWHICSCGETDAIQAHTWNLTNTVEPSCTAAGSNTYSCMCGASKTETVSAKEHTPDDGRVIKEPTETEEGIREYRCKDCNAIIKTEPIAKLDHTHTLDVNYTSDETGHWYKCSGCTEKVNFEAHTEDSGTVTKEPTETAEGERTYKCTKCGYVIRTESIPKKDPSHIHSYGTEWKYNSISHWHECTCGDKADTENHISDSGTVTKEPTETAEGERTYKCTKCGYVIRTESIPKKDPSHIHSYGTEWKYDSISHWHECTCGDKADTENHISDGGTVTKEPTETAEGERTYKCTKCGYVIRTESIPKKPAVPVVPAPVYPVYNTPSSPSFSTEPVTTSGKSHTRQKLTLKTETSLDSIRLSWNKISGAKKYTVYIYRNGRYEKLKDTAGTSFVFKKPVHGKTYRFLVRYSANGRLSAEMFSGKVTVTVYLKPAVTAYPGKNSIKLSWKPVSGAEKYAVYRYKNGRGSKIYETENTYAVIKNLKSGVKYSYVVRAYVGGKWTPMTRSDIVAAVTE